MAIYVLDLTGALPALGATEPPWHAGPMKVTRQVIMHVAYGTATALVFERVRKLPRRPVIKADGDALAVL